MLQTNQVHPDYSALTTEGFMDSITAATDATAGVGGTTSVSMHTYQTCSTYIHFNPSMHTGTRKDSRQHQRHRQRTHIQFNMYVHS